MFGNPEVTTGGRALKFYSSVRMDVRRIETLKQGGEVTGNRVRVKVVKNKIAPPFKEAEFDIMFGRGISKEGDILDLAVKENIIEKSGAWFAYNGSKIGQGRENAKQYLLSHPAICEEIEAQVRVKYNLPGAEEAEAQAREAAKKEEELTGSILPEGTEEELMAGEAERRMIVKAVVPVDKKKCKVFLEETLHLFYIKAKQPVSYRRGNDLPAKTYEMIEEEILLKRARDRALYLLQSRAVHRRR